MAKTYHALTIEIKEEISDIITAKQYDTNSRFLDVYLKDNGLPIDLTGNEVRIYGKKHDGTSFFNDGEITNAKNGRCQFELTSQALAVAGKLQIEISIWQDNKRILTTPTFLIFVSPKIRNDDAIESSNEFNALVVLFQKLYDFIHDASELLERVGFTTDTGGSATEGTVMAKMNQMLEYTRSIAQQTDSIQYRASNTLQIRQQKELKLTGGSTKMFQFQAEFNGFLWAHMTASNNSFSNVSTYVFRSLHDYINRSGSTNCMTPASLYIAPVDSVISGWEIFRQSASTAHAIFVGNNVIYGACGNDGGDVLNTSIPVLKGEQVVFLVGGQLNSTVTLELYYDEVGI